MGGRSTPPVTQSTTTQTLSPNQEELLGLGMPKLRDFANAPPPIPSYSGVAGFDPLQTQGQEAVLGGVMNQHNIVDSAGTGSQFLTSGDVLDVNRNPGLRGAVDAATRPITDKLLREALPAIRSGSALHGQYGSSRQGIAEGNAISGAASAVGDAASKVVNPAYQAGLDAMVKGVGLAPSTASAQSIPGLTTSGVGDVRQALAQALLGEQTSRDTTAALWPLILGQQFAGMAGSIPGGGSTNTQTGAVPQQPSGLMQGLGLGISGLGAMGGGTGLAALFGGAGAGAGAAAGAGTAAATLGGTEIASMLLPLMLAGSDRRMKEAIRRTGEFRGIPWYEFRYRGDDTVRGGVMSDEVPAWMVVRLNGVDLVDYGAL